MSGFLTHIPLYSAPEGAKVRRVTVPILVANGATLLHVTVDGLEDGDYGVLFEPEQVEKIEELRRWAVELFRIIDRQPKKEQADAS